MAHITANSHAFFLSKAHLSARARTVLFYVAVGLIATAVALPAAIMTASAPPL